MTVRNYFEWWYFDFLTSQRWAITLVLHLTDIFAGPVRPYISISVASPQGQRAHVRKYFPDNIDFEKTPLNFDFERCLVKEENRRVTLNIDLEKAHFTGVIEKLPFEEPISRIPLYTSNDAEGRHNWVVRIPCAPFSGQLNLGHDILALTGTAYYDHNWGNTRIQDDVREWFWGHLVFDTGYLIFYRITLCDKSVAQSLIFSLDRHRFVLPRFKLRAEPKANQQARQRVSDIVLELSEPDGLLLTVCLVLDRPFHYKHKRLESEALATYRRSIVEGLVVTSDNEYQTHGVVEHLSIGQGGHNDPVSHR